MIILSDFLSKDMKRNDSFKPILYINNITTRTIMVTVIRQYDIEDGSPL